MHRNGILKIKDVIEIRPLSRMIYTFLQLGLRNLRIQGAGQTITLLSRNKS